MLICHAALVQIVATEVDDQGRPIGEFTSSPVKVFRAAVPDVWREVDKTVARMATEIIGTTKGPG